MEIYLREGFSEGWGVSLIALDSLAPLGEMTESCGDAVSAVLQRKRRAGTLGGGVPETPTAPWSPVSCESAPASTALPGEVLGSAALSSSWGGARQRGGNFCLGEVRNTSLNVWCLLLAVGIQRVCARMGKGSTGSFLCAMFLTPARGCLWLKKVLLLAWNLKVGRRPLTTEIAAVSKDGTARISTAVETHVTPASR